MVHTRHSFKESFTLEKKERDDIKRERSPRRKVVDYQALVNGEGPHRQASKRRRHDKSTSFIFKSRKHSIASHGHFTRHSSRTTRRTSGSLSDTAALEDNFLHESTGRNAECHTEPRRSSRQRREVYGTLNETMLTKTTNEKERMQGRRGEDDRGDDVDDDEDDDHDHDDDVGNSDDDDDDDDDHDDDDDDDETEEQEDPGSQERPYSFREKRPMTRRYTAPPISGKSRRREAFYNAIPHSPMHKQRRRRMPQHSNVQKRKHYGSSTSSSDDSDDEHRFERRKSKSMAKARARCLPMNFKSGDILGVLKDRDRARERQGIGSSLADVDPMSIEKGVTFESVGGLDKHIRSLKEMIVFPLLYPEVFEKFKIAPPRGVLFYGPPGTGKTLVARALANECSSDSHKVAFFMRKGADCLSKWVGESERQLRLLFDQAYSMRPSIIFFDEIDGLAPVRSTRQDQIHSSIVSTLLALMDGLDSRGEVIVIGATNRIDSIDPALRRPGRFDREFLFTLPNRIARRSIIDIHTKEWQPRLSKHFIKELADQCVGYCGADIKALCTEAALIALRRRYPQIYGTNKKLVLDTDKIKITVKDFQYAIRKVVPASQRSVVSPGRGLHRILKPLLESTLCMILEKIKQFFPPANAVHVDATACGNVGARLNEDADDESTDEDDDNLPSIYEPLSYGRSTRATQRASTPPRQQHDFLHVIERYEMKKLSFRARFIMTGKEGMGQSTHLAPAVLHSMEHLKVYVLDLPSLFGVSARMPEEACSQIFTEARRTAPCVVYLPHVDVLWNSINDTCKATFLTLLEDVPASIPIILIATSNTTFEDLPSRVQALFSPFYHEVFEIPHPTDDQRRLFFQDLFLKNALEPPPPAKQTKAPRQLEVLQVAAPPPKRQLSDLELRNLREMEENIHRELRLFLRQIVWKLMADRKFKEFIKPVDLQEVPDYFEVIKEPMDLSTVMTKINSHKYISCKQFLKDVDLITNNCLEYNPDRDTYDRLLRNRACELRDTAHAMIYADLDPEFEKMCEEIHESRLKRNESEQIFAPSYIRVLQKNSHPMRASATTATSSSATKINATDDADDRHQRQASGQGKQLSTPERPTRQSRRLRGEETVEIPSFSSPIEKIIRSADGRRKREKDVKSQEIKSLDALKDGIEKDDQSKEDDCNGASMHDVTQLDESMEVDSCIVKEQKDANEKDGNVEEKPSKEEKIDDMDDDEEKSIRIVNNDEEREVDDQGGTESPKGFPTCLLLTDGYSDLISSDEDNESKNESLETDHFKNGDQQSNEANELNKDNEMEDSSKDKAKLDSLCNKDELVNRNALESLLQKLVKATQSATISSLEKTYYSIRNLIQKNRKNVDKTILIEELEKFVNRLSEQER